MRTNISRRNLNRKAAITTTWLVGLASIALPAAYAADDAKKEDAKKDDKKAEATSDEELRNWVDFTVGANLIHGDKAAFQQRTGQPRNAWGGVTDFHYEQDVGKKSLFEVDGRGIFDAHNYSIALGYKDPDRGYVRAGFQEFTTYYDESGGYFPGNGQFIDLYKQTGEIDRKKVFFEAGLTLENKPQLRIRYDYDQRDGTKNSTIWGDTGLIGIPGQVRKIVPTLNRIDEDHHSIALDISHTIGNTQAGIGGRYDFYTYDNARLERRNPFEASDRFITQREGVDTDLFNAHAWTETDFNDKVKLTTGYSYTKLDTDLSGSRAIGASFDADPSLPALQAFANRQARDEAFHGLNGGSGIDQHVGTISVMYRPTPTLTFVPSLRVEGQDQNGDAAFTELAVASNAARDVNSELEHNTMHRDFLDITESLDIRYTGITNWVMYVRGELLEGSGTLRETDRILADAGIGDPISRVTDSRRLTQKYTIGANWYPTKKLNLAVQYYHKVRENNYDNIQDTTPPTIPPGPQGYYPAFIEDQTFTTEDANIRVTYRPISSLSLVTRYDLQYTTIDSKMETLPEAQSARATDHIITESITWMPINRLYLQASGSYTLDQLFSPADNILRQLQVSKNNYYTASGSIGYALTEKTDISATYAYYLADNYDPSIFAVGLPLNASLEEHTIGGSITHRISKRMQVAGRYAFMTSHDTTSGGNNDFHAHLVSATLRYRF
jgi:hypothetical protein